EEERREWAIRVKNNGQHLLRLISDILNLSKVESGKLEIQTEEIDFLSLFKEAESTLTWTATAKDIRFQVDLQSPVPSRFRSDPTRLQQIFANVVGNAIKFTDEGCVSLKAGFDPKSKLLYFDVHDTGIGITAEEAERLFQPFMQLDASHSRRYGGTGLG